MIRDRIQIDGVWYIKETNALEELDISEFEGLIYEDTKAVFEATRMKNDEGIFYKDFDIKYTDKRQKPWKEEHWDNTTWFKNIMNGDITALSSALEVMDRETLSNLQRFLKYIIDLKKWEITT
jgi:hypothetical protein